ncbi:DUF4245 domain-containing protein [Nocardioides caeni]|uniref:DUF4245 domain-containing protein n=1 Tax=Nocardioides caeni TaxID=574700 RepID=A0A4S8ND76_9ACTN|nr:DUF4245 domain-containing protein [Nocardioides caeni]THV14543.1 DUF4245 domain-containing protein [Nocardioides caeni]
MSNEQQAPGRPGRYQRTTGGLVASMVVTVLGVGALLWFMGIFRPDFETRPEAVDYLDTVAAAQLADLEPIYPARLPDGWIATSVEVDPAGEPVFRVGLLTDDDKFVSVEQQDASPLTLVGGCFNGEEPVEIDGFVVPTDVPRPVAREWEGYSDGDRNVGYVAEVGDVTVLVCGSAPEAELQAVVASLTTAPID